MVKYVYLDSNAFWHLKHADRDYDEDFSNIVTKLRKSASYRFPFSPIHFLDIKPEGKVRDENLIKNDLTTLSMVSDGYAVILQDKKTKNYFPVLGPNTDWGAPWITQLKYENISELYYNMPPDDAASREPLFLVQGSTHKVNLNKIHKTHPLRKTLEDADGLYSPQLLEDYLYNLFNGHNDAAILRPFREWTASALANLCKTDSLLGPSLPEEIKPLKDFISAKTITDIASSLYDATKAVCALRKENIDEVPWARRIEEAYNLLDFHPELWEPINKKNRPSNMRRDAKHLIHAAGARHLVTADKHFMQKAAVTFTSFGIKTKISSISQFKANFS